MNLGNFISAVLFEQVRDYVLDMISQFGYAGMGRMFTLVIAIGTLCLTLWFIWQGWRMVTGQSRESLMTFFTQAFMVIVVAAAAQGFAVLGQDVPGMITWLQDIIANTLTGGDFQDPSEMVSDVLKYMLTLQSLLQVYQGGGSAPNTGMANTLTFITGAGQALPALVAGGLMLLNEVALHLSMVFAPLFILSYISPKTRFLFANWVKFTVTTLFSMVVLTVVTVIALKAIIMMAVALFTIDTTGSIVGTGGMQLNDIATVTGGVGMLLTTLILGVPPLVVSFFSGGIAQAYGGYNQFGNAATRTGGGMAPAAGPQDLMLRGHAEVVGQDERRTASLDQFSEMRTRPLSSSSSAASDGIKKPGESLHGVSAGQQEGVASQRLAAQGAPAWSNTLARTTQAALGGYAVGQAAAGPVGGAVGAAAMGVNALLGTRTASAETAAGAPSIGNGPNPAVSTNQSSTQGPPAGASLPSSSTANSSMTGLRGNARTDTRPY